MVDFSRYFIGFLRTFFYNFGMFFKRLWEAFSNALFKDIVGYFEDLINASNDFKFLDWFCEIIVMLLMVAFFTFVILRLYQLFRRYVRFTRREIEKDALLEEVSQLNIRAAELVDEKNKILAMKVSSLGIGTNNDYSDEAFNAQDKEEDEIKKKQSNSRFVKLTAVDEEYRTKITTIMMGPSDMLPLNEIVDKFVNFAASQLNLYYDKRIIRAYFAGLATTKILILQGISGTGKTSSRMMLLFVQYNLHGEIEQKLLVT